MEKLELSVLLSVHSGENPEWLSLCLESLSDQAGQISMEIVIVRDGPLNTELDMVLTGFATKNNAVIVNLEQNQGLGAALNAGLLHCSRSFVARIDADDIAFPNRFGTQIEYLNSNPTIDIVGSYAVEIDSAGRKGAIRTMPISHLEIYNSLWACPLIHPSIMFRREKILSLGSYNPKLRRRQDYELWFRCAQNNLQFANIPKPLLYYRFDHSTHKKQPSRLAWEQGKIGFIGSYYLGLAWWKRFACFIPFIRSLLPTRLQHNLYKFLKILDPRNKY